MHTFEQCMELLKKLKRLEYDKFHSITFYQDYSGKFMVDDVFGFYFTGLDDLYNRLVERIEEC